MCRRTFASFAKRLPQSRQNESFSARCSLFLTLGMVTVLLEVIQAKVPDVT